jgi:hypothetical protein
MRVSTRLSALCAAVLVPASLLAQSQPCASLNDSSNSVSTAITALNFAVGNNTYAWRFVPQQVHVATGLRIYTNNNFKAGFMKLEIWDESGSAPEPGKRLGGGTWRYEQDSTPKWQGAAFDGPIPLRPQTAYWFVWQEPGFSTVPTEPGAALMSGSVRLSGSSWVSTQASELKWRLYCQGLDTVGTQSYGPSCPSSSQQLGALFNNEAPVLGNTNFRLEASGLPSSAPAPLADRRDPQLPQRPRARRSRLQPQHRHSTDLPRSDRWRPGPVHGGRRSQLLPAEHPQSALSARPLLRRPSRGRGHWRHLELAPCVHERAAHNDPIEVQQPANGTK